MVDGPLMTSIEIAEALGFEPKTVTGWARDHLVPGVVRVANQWRWPKSALEWIRTHGVSRRRRNLRVARGRKTY
jgi:predicted site-specific integrase-resolvase